MAASNRRHTTSSLARIPIITLLSTIVSSLRGSRATAFVSTIQQTCSRRSHHHHHIMSSTQPALSFDQFLSSPRSNSTTFTVGNQAGDADSIISALALAYVDYLNDGPDAPHKTPVVSIPRADLVLRRDVVLLLQLANVDTTKLIHVEDIATVPNPQLILVDHNRLVHTEFQAPTIVEILDHHFDEGHHVEAKKTICFGDTAVASTCTLITERWTGRTTGSTDLALALLGVLLLDTVNSSPSAGKLTIRDTAAMNKLLQQTDWTSLPEFLVHGTNQLDTTRLFDHLSNAKFDVDFWQTLSVNDALRLDYKRFEATTNHIFGVSSVLLPMRDFVEKHDLMKQLKDYLTWHQIPILLVMSFSLVNGTPQRDIMVCGTNADLVNQVNEYLLNDESLQATKVDTRSTIIQGTNGIYITWMSQGNARASRKQVAPIVLEFFSKIDMMTGRL
jgi:exopolyphosphatase